MTGTRVILIAVLFSAAVGVLFLLGIAAGTVFVESVVHHG